MKKLFLVGLAICYLILCSGQLTVSYALPVTLWADGANDGAIHFHQYPPSWGGSWYDGWKDINSSNLPVNSTYYSPGWERDYVYVEIPIAPLQTGTVTSAILQIYSNGFANYYYYGSTKVYYLNPGSYNPTGDVSVDNPQYWAATGGWDIFNTDVPNSENPGLRSFDVTAEVLADLAVSGRDFITFFIQASRETYGSVAAAENTGFGPRLQVQVDGISPVPEPATMLLLGSGLIGLAGFRRKFKKS